MSDPDALRRKLDEIQDAPPPDRGPLHRFVHTALGVSQKAFVPDLATGKNRRDDYDPAVHAPEDARDFVAFTLTPVDPRFRVITREVLVGSKEFALTLASIQELGLRLSDLDGAFTHICFQPDEAELGTHPRRDGTRGISTYLRVLERFADEEGAPDEEACRLAAEAFFKRGSDAAQGEASAAGAATTPATNAAPSSDGWTDAQRAERGTLLAFLPAIAQGKDLAGFVAALKDDPRLSRYFKATDPDVVAILTKVGVIPPAPTPGA
jgi:hypothetical protein